MFASGFPILREASHQIPTSYSDIFVGKSHMANSKPQDNRTAAKVEDSGDHEKADEVMDVDDVNHNKDDQAEEFLRASVSNQGNSNIDVTFLRWTQLQSTFWIALDISTSPRNIPMTVLRVLDISVVHVKYPSGATMLSWTQLLQGLYSSTNAEAIKNKVVEGIKKHLNDQPHDNIFNKCFPPSYKPGAFSGNQHCEMIVALLIVHVRLLCDGPLKDLIQVQFHLCDDIHQLNGLFRNWMKPQFQYRSYAVQCAGASWPLSGIPWRTANPY